MNTDSWRTSQTDGRAARWHAHREARRAELLTLAQKAVHRIGAGVSMDEIAETAGTSKSVFYRYFGDKSGLQLALAEDLARQMQEQMSAAEEESLSAATGIRAMIRTYLLMAAASPNVYFFVTERIVGVAEAQGSFAGLFTHLENQFTAYHRKHLNLPNDDEDVATWQHWPKAAIGLVRAAGESWLAEPNTERKPTLEAMTDRISEWLIEGLSNRRGKQHEVETP